MRPGGMESGSFRFSICTTHVRNRLFPEEFPKARPEDHVHRFAQIFTDRRAERRRTQWCEERDGAIPALCLLGFTPGPSFFLSVSICENLWIPCFSILGFFPSWVAASPRWVNL